MPWGVVLNWVDVSRTLKAVTLFVCLWKSSNDPAVGWEIVSSGHRLRSWLCHQLLLRICLFPPF